MSRSAPAARTAASAVLGLVLLAAAPFALAQSSTGSLAGWSVYGDAVSQAGRITLTTAYLDGDPLGDQPRNLSGQSAVDIAVLEAAAGVPAYGLDLSAAQYGTEGSLVKQTFAATAGQTVRFDWSFATLEAASPTGVFLAYDRAFVVFNGVVSTLATAVAPGAASQTFTRTLSATGPVTLSFGMIDTVDVLGVSSLTVGNLQLVPAVAAVPEPATAALLLGGLGLIGAAARRRRAVTAGRN